MPRRLSRLALMVALALILSYFERLLPLPVPVPGVKLGLSNLVTLVALCLFGWRDALIVSVVRVLLGGLLFGSGLSMLYALAGALLSLLVMALLHSFSPLHPAAISAVGGVAHNIGQLLVAALVVHTPALLSYLPVLMLSGTLTGALIGALGTVLIGRLRPVIHAFK